MASPLTASPYPANALPIEARALPARCRLGGTGNGRRDARWGGPAGIQPFGPATSSYEPECQRFAFLRLQDGIPHQLGACVCCFHRGRACQRLATERQAQMKPILIGAAIVIAGSSLFVSKEARSQVGPPAFCVEVVPADIAASRRRAGSNSDCNSSAALARAIVIAQFNASQALRPICFDHITLAMADRTCGRAGLIRLTVIPSGETPIPAPGTSPPTRSEPTGAKNQGAVQICALLRNLPGETVTSTSPAGPQNGFCIFDNGRVTSVTARARATCGVQCRQ
jgi:hypothetical protein